MSPKFLYAVEGVGNLSAMGCVSCAESTAPGQAAAANNIANETGFIFMAPRFLFAPHIVACKIAATLAAVREAQARQRAASRITAENPAICNIAVILDAARC